MQYLLLMRGTPGPDAPGELPLRSPWDATTLRGWGEALEVVPGPLFELDQPVQGTRLIEAPDLAAAVELAARDPFARTGAVEVREVWTDFSAEPAAPLEEVVA